MPRKPPLELVGWRADNDGFAAYHVQVGVEFFPLPGTHPYRPQVSDRKPIQVRLSDLDAPEDASLVGLAWQKQMGVAAGQFQLQLKARPSLDEALHDQLIGPGDWCLITVYRNGVPLPLCVGRLDTVHEGKRSVGGATATVWTLTGRDHGALFEYPITYTSMFVQTLSEIVQGIMTERVQSRVGGRPDELFELLITATYGAGLRTGQWVLPPSLLQAVAEKAPPQTGLAGVSAASGTDQDVALESEGKRFIELLEVVSLPVFGKDGLRGSYHNEVQLWTAGAQNLHETLTQWVNPLLNEFWYDLLPPAGQLSRHDHGLSQLEGSGPRGKAGAIIRERPFVSTALGQDSPWFFLPRWDLPTWTLERRDMARSDAGRKNLFHITVGLGFNHDEFAALERPIWDLEDIRRNGLRQFDQSTRFVEGDSLADYSEGRKEWIRLLADWWAPAPYLRSGSIQARVMAPEIRIGQRLALIDGNPAATEHAYVEGVQLSYQAPPGANAGPRSTTGLTLTRGFVGTDQELLKAVEGLSVRFVEVEGPA